MSTEIQCPFPRPMPLIAQLEIEETDHDLSPYTFKFIALTELSEQDRQNPSLLTTLYLTNPLPHLFKVQLQAMWQTTEENITQTQSFTCVTLIAPNGSRTLYVLPSTSHFNITKQEPTQRRCFHRLQSKVSSLWYGKENS